MIFAETDLSYDPTWPGSIPNVGLPAMLAIALALAALTIWTYAGVRKVSWRQVGVVLILRLAALLLAFFMMMRPSLGFTHLEGVESSKLLVVIDSSESMTVDDASSKTRWDQVNRLWASRNVQRRLEQLAAEQKIDVVKYHGAEDIRPAEEGASATGKRTDIGAWLHQLREKHGLEKHLRGIAIFSDGADNGTRFSALDQARAWHGICPIHTFGAGNPNDPRFGKDLILSNLTVAQTLIPVRSKMKIEAVVQAPGYDKTPLRVGVSMENVKTREVENVAPEMTINVAGAKKQRIDGIEANAPKDAGEYKLTLKIAPATGEAKEAREISTYVKVIKEKIEILWVDRPRFYEPVFAVRSLASQKQFNVHFALPAPKENQDPLKYYELDKYDVIIIGDLSAQRFAMGKPAEIFKKIKELVVTKGVGLLLLGGTDAFANGGWDEQADLMELMPVTFEKKPFAPEDFVNVAVMPTAAGMTYSFLQMDPNPKQNLDFWQKTFEELNGVASLGKPVEGTTVLLETKNGAPAMVSTRKGKGNVAVFGGDSTWKKWGNTPAAVAGYHSFWKKLAMWLAQQQDAANPLWINMDSRKFRAGEPFSFTFGLRGAAGADLPGGTYEAKIVRADGKAIPVAVAPVGAQQRGAFQGSLDPGEYQLVIKGSAGDAGGSKIHGEESARFLVEAVDVEMRRPAADHKTLSDIAVAGDGTFSLADETMLLQFLEGLKNQVNGESRRQTTRWPDWKHLPASDQLRDQLSGLWHSFSLVSFALFVLLLGSEWLLRRWWGLV